MSRQKAALSALPTVVITVAPNALASWIAVSPMPPDPPWTSTVSPADRWTAVEEIVPDGEVILRQARRFLHDQAVRQRQAMLRRCHAVLGVTAARRQRANPVADAAIRTFLRRPRRLCPATSSPMMGEASAGGG